MKSRAVDLHHQTAPFDEAFTKVLRCCPPCRPIRRSAAPHPGTITLAPNDPGAALVLSLPADN